MITTSTQKLRPNAGSARSTREAWAVCSSKVRVKGLDFCAEATVSPSWFRVQCPLDPRREDERNPFALNSATLSKAKQVAFAADEKPAVGDRGGGADYFAQRVACQESKSGLRGKDVNVSRDTRGIDLAIYQQG